jgi:hypothetical protein
VTFATFTAPFSSGLDLQVQLQAAVRLVPAPAAKNANQLTVPADAAQLAVNWVIENPARALLWAGLVMIGCGLFAEWCESQRKAA